MLALGTSLVANSAFADNPVTPAYSSSPGAAYTLYLDFSGFTFNGTWGNTGKTPGTLSPFNTDGNATTFSTTELSSISKIWTRTAEKYAPFNINITTVDPAVAAGQAANDTLRQQYYDHTSSVMHSIITPSSGWYGSAGGVSYVGVVPNYYSNGGYKTNFIFPNKLSNNNTYIAEAVAHEDGHALGLWHKAVVSGGVVTGQYSEGHSSPSQAPIMGNSYYASRGQWSSSTTTSVNNSTTPTAQNDAQILANNPGLDFINDGVGRSFSTASDLFLTGTSVNYNLAKGVIVPASQTAPNPTGVANYTAGYWAFATGAGNISLSLQSGRSTINPGTADPGAMLDATLELLNSSGIVIASSGTNANFSETVSATVAAGRYTLRVTSAGDPLSRGYYDMGSYFLTGNVLAAAAANLTATPSGTHRTTAQTVTLLLANQATTYNISATSVTGSGWSQSGIANATPASGDKTATFAHSTVNAINGSNQGRFSFSVDSAAAGNGSFAYTLANNVAGIITTYASSYIFSSTFGQDQSATILQENKATSYNVRGTRNLNSNQTGSTFTIQDSQILGGDTDTKLTMAIRKRINGPLNNEVSITVTYPKNPFGGGGSDSPIITYNSANLVSDVVRITGLDTKLFVLSISYNPNDLHPGFEEKWLTLGWLNDDGNWVNAVNGNYGGTSFFRGDIDWLTGIDGSLDSTDLGKFGVYTNDLGGNYVWAVLNHNSDFSAMIPEPASLSLLFLASSSLLLRRTTPSQRDRRV